MRNFSLCVSDLTFPSRLGQRDFYYLLTRDRVKDLGFLCMQQALLLLPPYSASGKQFFGVLHTYAGACSFDPFLVVQPCRNPASIFHRYLGHLTAFRCRLGHTGNPFQAQASGTNGDVCTYPDWKLSSYCPSVFINFGAVGSLAMLDFIQYYLRSTKS